jgi:hypothetical protein
MNCPSSDDCPVLLWSDEIRARLAQLDAATAKTILWSKARRRSHAAAGRVPRP